MDIFSDDELWKPKDEKIEEDKQGTLSHAASVIANSLGRGFVTGVPYLSELLQNIVTPHGQIGSGDHEEGGTGNDVGFKKSAMGQGPMMTDVNKHYSKIAGNPTPRNKPEEWASAISQGVGASVLPGEELVGLLKGALSGATAGASAMGAHELFPDNEWLPLIVGLIGGGIPAIAHPVFTSINGHRMIKQGMEHPAFAELLPAVIKLEAGGSLEHPNTSPKGAMGVMQVMPDTARRPGFGIKPWDGKSQADLARVGRDYLAAMTRKYNGDHAKILAAYNGGPGMVDGLVRRYGDNWTKHLNDETAQYVEHGLQKVVDQKAPEAVSNVVPLEPKGSLEELSGLSPEEVQRHLVERENPPEDVLTLAERQDMDASAPKPVVDNTGYEKFTPDSEPPAPANENADIFDAFNKTNPDHPDYDPNHPFAQQPFDPNEGGGMGPNDPIFGGEPPQGPPQEPPTGGGGEEPPSGGDEPPSGGDGGSEPPREPLSTEELFTKVTDALKRAKPAWTKQRKLYSDARKAKMADLIAARKASGGVEGFHAEKAQLRGELPTADYEGLTGISHEDITALFDHVKNHPSLGYFQSLNAREGLAKMLQGDLPAPRERELLARTMPPELLRQLSGSKSLLSRALENTANVLNISKALMASYDISAPMRQGVLMIGRKEFYTSLIPMVRSFASPKYQRAVFESIYRDPLFSAMQDSDLAVPVYQQHNGGPALMDAEEPYMTNLAQKIPVVGIGVRASERAYNTFVYKLRADTFKSLYNLGKSQGKIWDQDSLKDLSRFINTFTGRGDLGRFNNLAPILNAGLFSPKLLKSRIDSINVLPGGFYAKLDPFVRKEAMKSMMGFVAFAATAMGLAKLAGAEVGGDPREADGWKIKLGNTRYDLMGGEQQLVRLMGNVATFAVNNGKELAKTGKIHVGYKDKTGIDAMGQFLRNKESPDVSLGHDFLSGRDAVGQDVTALSAIGSRVSPMVAQDAYDAYSDLRDAGAPVDKSILLGTLKASPSLVGVGATTYPPHESKKKGVDIFDDPSFWGEKEEQKDVFDSKLWGSE